MSGAIQIISEFAAWRRLQTPSLPPQTELSSTQTLRCMAEATTERRGHCCCVARRLTAQRGPRGPSLRRLRTLPKQGASCCVGVDRIGKPQRQGTLRGTSYVVSDPWQRPPRTSSRLRGATESPFPPCLSSRGPGPAGLSWTHQNKDEIVG